ncbi:MAG: hypothetical protein DRP79_06380, partial [Planctomycetota bacterium]
GRAHGISRNAEARSNPAGLRIPGDKDTLMRKRGKYVQASPSIPFSFQRTPAYTLLPAAGLTLAPQRQTPRRTVLHLPYFFYLAEILFVCLDLWAMFGYT